jgi:nitrite reductase (NO-forming)
MRRMRLGLAGIALVLCAAAGMFAAGAGLGASPARDATANSASVAKVTTKVTVSAAEFKFKLSRTSVPVGTVIFTVVNKGKIAHDFKINGKKTPLIKPGKKATLTVVFKKAGKFAYLCTVPGHAAAGMKGVLGVGQAAPPPPTTTATATFPGPGGTVTVTMFEYGFTLSPSTIPSGNVTFVMNNTGNIVHNFDIETVQPGPFINSGASATEVVNLQAGRTYTYVCDVPFHAEMGMEGTFTPTP